jgi:uncharacterized protein YjbI with pentapeptide repeats
MTSLQSVISIILAWVAVPFALLALWARFLTRHDWTVTWIHIVCLTIGFGYSILTYKISKRTLLGQKRNPFIWKSSLKDIRLHKSLFVTAIITIFFFICSEGAINGIPPDRGDGFRTYVPFILGLVGCEPFANFQEKDVSIKPDNWTGDSTQIPLVKGANLRGKELRFANLKSAFLVNADLRDADLSNSYIRRADFRFSNLHKAKLDSATVLLDFGNSILDTINLTNMVIGYVGKKFIHKREDSLIGFFRYANMDSISLVEACFPFSDFTNATLVGANLNGTFLRFSDLTGAYLLESQLSLDQLKFLTIDSTTILPDYLLEELKKDTSFDLKIQRRRLGID